MRDATLLNRLVGAQQRLQNREIDSTALSWRHAALPKVDVRDREVDVTRSGLGGSSNAPVATHVLDHSRRPACVSTCMLPHRAAVMLQCLLSRNLDGWKGSRVCENAQVA